MWMLLAAPVALASAGCFLIPSAPRPDPNAPIAGPVPYVDNCQLCHASPVAAHYAMSVHTTKGIRCGQCHTPGGHPNFTQPVSDGKCGGCHQPQYQESLVSTHFATRAQMALDTTRPRGRRCARKASPRPPRRGVAASWATRPPGELGGRLCAACHYDEHRLDLAVVRRDGFCTGCHGARPDHFDFPAPEGTNRCLQCHVRVGADRERSGGQLASIRQAGSGERREVSLQESFDADLRRAMSRRQFLTRLARASSAAILLSSPLGCGKLRGRDRASAVSATRRRRSTPCSRRSSPKSSTASTRPTPRSASGSPRRIRTTTRSPPTRSSPRPAATSSWPT